MRQYKGKSRLDAKRKALLKESEKPLRQAKKKEKETSRTSITKEGSKCLPKEGHHSRPPEKGCSV